MTDVSTQHVSVLLSSINQTVDVETFAECSVQNVVEGCLGVILFHFEDVPNILAVVGTLIYRKIASLVGEEEVIFCILLLLLGILRLVRNNNNSIVAVCESQSTQVELVDTVIVCHRFANIRIFTSEHDSGVSTIILCCLPVVRLLGVLFHSFLHDNLPCAVGRRGVESLVAWNRHILIFRLARYLQVVNLIVRCIFDTLYGNKLKDSVRRKVRFLGKRSTLKVTVITSRRNNTLQGILFASFNLSHSICSRRPVTSRQICHTDQHNGSRGEQFVNLFH